MKTTIERILYYGSISCAAYVIGATAFALSFHTQNTRLSNLIFPILDQIGLLAAVLASSLFNRFVPKWKILMNLSALICSLCGGAYILALSKLLSHGEFYLGIPLCIGVTLLLSALLRVDTVSH